MLRYTEKDILSVNLKVDVGDIEHYDDILVETLHHLSYAGNDLSLLYFEMLDEKTHIVECDYCGKLLNKKRMGNYHRMLKNKYVDEDAEYPCTDNCCKNCIGKKNEIVWWEKYGVTHIFKLNEYKSNEKAGFEVPCSRPQQLLANLLNGEVNVRFKEIGGFIDIVIEDEKLIVEYDGSGHYLGIEFGKYTYEEKLKQDYERDLIMRSLGYKIVRIESESDYLPSNEVILAKISEIKEYLSVSGEEFFKWIIPKSAKDRSYGKLRKIRKEDL